MKTHIQLLAILALLLSFTACGSDNPITPGDDNLGVANPASSSINFFAKVDGADWEATEVTAVQHDGAGGTGSNVRQFTIKGENEAGDVIQFVLQRNTSEAFGPGIYKVDHVPSGTDDYFVTFLYSGGGQNFQTIQGMSTGEIEITKISGKQVEGTFQAELQDFSGGSLKITEGTFMSDKYGTFY